MAQRQEPAEDPYDPENEYRHAGKVFVLTQKVLHAASAKASDGSDPSVLADRFLLCLWDVDDDTSLWIALQSNGDYEITHGNKRLSAGSDPNWMDASIPSKYRDGTVWRLGRCGKPFRHSQGEQRFITRDELLRVQGRISEDSINILVGGCCGAA